MGVRSLTMLGGSGRGGPAQMRSSSGSPGADSTSSNAAINKTICSSSGVVRRPYGPRARPTPMAMLTNDERGAVGDPEAIADAAVGLWQSMRERPEVAAAVAGTLLRICMTRPGGNGDKTLAADLARAYAALRGLL